MLNTNEIRNYERRYEAYMAKNRSFNTADQKRPKKSKFLFWFLSIDIVATVALVGFLAVNEFIQDAKIKEGSQDPISAQIHSGESTVAQGEVKARSTQAKAKFEDSSKQDDLVNKIAERIEQNLRSNPQSGDDEQRYTRGDKADQGWLKLNLNDEWLKTSAAPKEETLNFDPALQNSQNTYYQPAPLPKKVKIDIQVSNSKDELGTLKEEFATTNNAVYALEIAKINFSKSNYQEALKWALIANEIDNKLEEAWTIFAKSKYKLNQKSDALRALKEYNKTAKKQSIETLIKQIESDTL